MSVRGALWGGAANDAEKAAVAAVGAVVGYKKSGLGSTGSDRVEINKDTIRVCSTSEPLRGGDTAHAKHEAVKEALTDAGVTFHEKGSLTDTLLTGTVTDTLEIKISENGGLDALTAKLQEAAQAKGQEGGFAAKELARRAGGEQSQGAGRGGG